MLAAIGFAIEHKFDYLAEPRRRFQPSAAIHSRPARGHGRPRRHDRLALCSRRRGRGRVHAQAPVDERRDQRLRPAAAWPEEQGQQRRVSVLSGQQAGRDRPEPGSLARLLVSGRDSLLVPEGRLPDRRNADPVREPPCRQLEDQHARSGFGALDLAAAGNVALDRPRDKTRRGCSAGRFQPEVDAYASSRSRTVT